MVGTPPRERITHEGSADRKSFTDHVNHAFQFSVMILERFVRLIDSWASRLAIERRTQQDLCPARRSTFSLSLYTEPERAIALFVDHAHKVASSSAFWKLGSLSARRGDDGRSERLALGHPPSAGWNQLHLCRALRLEDPAATGETHSLDAVLTTAKDTSV